LKLIESGKKCTEDYFVWYEGLLVNKSLIR
ncbi:unnamed protein product, partial [marine sediment metagenome]